MNSEDFKNNILNKSKVDYGICPPPTNAQEGLKILIDHFLGEDWYVSLSISQEQVNTEAIYQILRKYPKRRTFKEWLIN
jgi:hypothetical protein